MFLTKRCNKKYNIKNGTLKLGTLEDYRKTEIAQIADPHEGTTTFRLIFVGAVKIPTLWFNTLNGVLQAGSTPGLTFPGTTAVRGAPTIQIIDSNDEFVTLQNSSIEIRREALNGFVYCMSRLQYAKDCIELFPDYDDYWYMSYDDATAFAQTVSEIILETITKKHQLGFYITPKSINPEELSIYYRVGDVAYTHREIVINNHGEFSIDDFMRKLATMTFIKPTIPFEREKEFRFEFNLMHNDNIIEPSVQSLIIDADRLQKYISKDHPQHQAQLTPSTDKKL